MKKILFSLGLAGMLLTGCSEEATTQHECLEQGLFKYDSQCIKWNDIPEDEQEGVMLEIAEEVAEAQGITVDEAMQLMYLQIEEIANQ